MNTQFIQEQSQNNKIIGKKIVFYEQTTSTNDIAKDLIAKGEMEGVVVITDYQTCGRGRQGNIWESEPEVSILLSVILYPKLNLEDMQQIVDIGMESVIEVLRYIVPDANIEKKYPNDVFANGKKIAGILVESSSKFDIAEYAVLGIGIDVNNKIFSAELEGVAVSLWQVAGREFSREEIVVDLLKVLDKTYRGLGF